MGEKRGMKALELWARRVTDGYPGVKIDNMTTSWRNGLAFCALIHHFRPHLIDFESLNARDIVKNNELAFRVAERQLGIPALLDAEDMLQYEIPDRLSILTYLSQFYQVFHQQGGTSGGSGLKHNKSSSVTDMVSPPNSPAVKVGGGRVERCLTCSRPVFLAERLLVGGKLRHRSCFTCARCSHLLNPVSCYETEAGQFVCEVCPDEQPTHGVLPVDFHDDNFLNSEKTNEQVMEEPPLPRGADLASQLPAKPPDPHKTKFLNQILDGEKTESSSDSGLSDSNNLDVNAKNLTVNISVDKLVSKLDDNARIETEHISSTAQRGTNNDSSPENQQLTGENAIHLKSGFDTKIQQADNDDTKGIENELPVDNDLSKGIDHDLSARNGETKGTENELLVDNDLSKEIENELLSNVTKRIENEVSSENDETKRTENELLVDNDLSKVIENELLSNVTKRIENEVSSENDETKRTENELLVDNDLSKEIENELLSNVTKRIENEVSSENDETKGTENELLVDNDLSKVIENELLSDVAKRIEDEVSSENDETKGTENELLGDNDVGKEIENELLLDVTKRIDDDLSAENDETKGTENDFSVHSTNDIDDGQDKKNEIVSNFKENYEEEIKTSYKELNLVTVAAQQPAELNDKSFITNSSLPSSPKVNEETNLESDTDNESFNKILSDNSLNLENRSIDLGDIEPQVENHQQPELLDTSQDLSSEDRSSTRDVSQTVPSQELDVDVNEDAENTVEVRSDVKVTIVTDLGDEMYPSKLNPFGDSDEDEQGPKNPFAESEDEIIPAIPVPSPRICKKVELNMEGKKVIEAPRNLNPFCSDSDDDDEELKPPGPAPRTRLTPEPLPRSRFGSATSITSQISPGKKKKRPAPPPPTSADSLLRRPPSPGSSLSSPSGYSSRSPVPARRRKSRAPPPPPLLATAADDKDRKDYENTQKQNQLSPPSDKSTYGKWKRKKGAAPGLPVPPQRRRIVVAPLSDINQEVEDLEVQQTELERQGVKLEQTIRKIEESGGGAEADENNGADRAVDVEEMVLQLFEIVNQKNELFRRQAELMFLRKQQRLEEEHADIEYQIRCLMGRPKDQADPQLEEKLISRLIDVVERRNEIIDCLDMNRRRAAEEDQSIHDTLMAYTARDANTLDSTTEEESPIQKKSTKSVLKLIKKKREKRKEKELLEKKKNDADVDIDESVVEVQNTSEKSKAKKKWFKLDIN